MRPFLEALRETLLAAEREAAPELMGSIVDHWGEAWDHAVPRVTVARLRDMGVLEEEDSEQEEVTVFRPTPVGRELLTEVARVEPSPLSVMAQTMLDDLTLSLAPADSRTRELGAAEAVARQARLVAHELNNALVPVRSAFGQLAR